MYNQEWKNFYLSRNNFSDLEKESIKVAFIKAKQFEEHYNNDLCKFNMNEVKNLLESTENKFNQLYYDYCNWCMQEVYVSYYINPYKMFIEDDEL